MRIALRTGGGRGVYELAGRQGYINASDLFDREIFYEFTPDIIIPGRAMASRLQGKPRIRLDDQQVTTHFYRLLAAVLLLPKPKREFKKTRGGELLKFESYSMTAIKVDISDISATRVLLRPSDLLLETADNLQEQLSFEPRMSRILRLWRYVRLKSIALAVSVQAHEKAVLAKDPNHKTIEHRAQDISDMLQTDGDPLPEAERQLGISDSPELYLPIIPHQITHQAEFGVDDDTPPSEARIKRLKVWRQLAIRGSSGLKFRRTVASAYDYRCLFSGQRLPRLQCTESPGVDVAHILPWSTHNIDSPRNGICLNKLCHWAFDEGIIRLHHDKNAGLYILEVPDQVRSAATRAVFDLDYFEALTGPIPFSRLPKNQKFWPSPKCLAELDRVMTCRIS